MIPSLVNTLASPHPNDPETLVHPTCLPPRTYQFHLVAETYWQPAGSRRPQGTLGLLLSCSRPRTGDSQLWFTAWPLPCTSRSSTISDKLRSLYSSDQVALDWSQAIAGLSLHQSPSQEAPDPTHPVAGFRPQWSTT